MKQNKQPLEEAIINSHDNRIKSLEFSIGSIKFWLFLLWIFSLGLCILITIAYFELPHRVCHTEEVTTKVEIKSIDPYHMNNLGIIKIKDYPNSEIACEPGVTKDLFLNAYIGDVGKICIITTKQKVCEIK